jgi:hypothetical protein
MPRLRSVRIALTDAEYAEMSAAARRAGLTRGAYAAEATLAVARGMAVALDALLRDALHAADLASQLVRRIGVNLNQAVARLNATGQRSGDLVPYAAESMDPCRPARSSRGGTADAIRVRDPREQATPSPSRTGYRFANHYAGPAQTAIR